MEGPTYRCIGLVGNRIAALSAEPDGLNDFVGPDTAVIDAPDLTLLPAFADSHEHLMEASRNTLKVPVDHARSVAPAAAVGPEVRHRRRRRGSGS
jgi:predicted amidohydrolase YtcJ